MNIMPISLTPQISMKSANGNIAKKTDAQPRVISPAAMGVVNGVCWFGIGYLFDKCCKSLFKTNPSNKTSLILNGIIGVAMGTYAYVKSKQIQNEALKSQK